MSKGLDAYPDHRRPPAEAAARLLRRRWCTGLVPFMRRVRRTAFVLAVWAAAGWAGEGTATVGRLDIVLPGAAEDSDELRSTAADLILLRPGRPFTQELARQSRSALLISGKFASAELDTTRRGDTVDVGLSLTPAQYLGEIRIRGEFPFFESQILEVMTIYPGDVFRPDSLARQAQAVRSFLEREGFIAPEVQARSHRHGGHGHHVVEVRIKKKGYRVADDIEIEGNARIGNARLLVRMGTWRSKLLPGSAGRFVSSKLDKDVKELTRFYRRRGFAEAHIDYTVTPDTAGRGGRRGEHNERPLLVSLRVHEGPRYDISIDAPRRVGPVGSRRMLEELDLVEKGNRNRTALRRGLKSIREILAAAGYLNPGIEVDDSIVADDKGPVRRLAIHVEPGTQTMVSSVTIEGNESVETQAIRGQMITGRRRFLGPEVYVPDTLARDLFAVRTLYANRGFLGARVTEEVTFGDDSATVDIAVRIREGVRSVVTEVTVVGEDSVANRPIAGMLSTREGRPYRPYAAENDARIVSGAIAREGYPHVTARHTARFSDDSAEVSVKFEVDRGPRVTVGRILCTGNLRTRRRAMVRELGVEPGQPFSLSEVLEGERALRNWEAFNSVGLKTVGLKEKEDEVDLVIDVRERKPFYMRTGLGYHSDRKLFGRAELGDRNMFGLNQRGWLSGDIGLDPTNTLAEIRRKTSLGAKAGIHDPRFLGLPVSATLGFSGRRDVPPNQTFGTITAGPRLDLGRQWGSRLSTSLGVGYQYRKQFEQNPDLPPGDSVSLDKELQPRHVLSGRPSLIFDSRDSFIRPTGGVYATFTTDISTGLGETEEDFARLRAEVRYYLAPVERLTVATALRLGHLRAFDSTYRPPRDQLFFLGGSQDVRGYDENMLEYTPAPDSLGGDAVSKAGRTAISGSLELRIDVGYGFELPVFYDAGYLGDRVTRDFVRRIRSSAGAGIRYLSPVGPIGLLYAWKINPRRGESPGKFHFSIGYPF